MISYLKIIKKYKLDNYLKILIEENSSNNLPYHNFYHILCVMYHAFLISKNVASVATTSSGICKFLAIYLHK